MDLPRPDLTAIRVRVSCPDAGCTLGTPCPGCVAELAAATEGAAQRLAARHGHPVGDPCDRCARILTASH